MAGALKQVQDELQINVTTVQAYAFCGISDNNIRDQIPSFNKTCSAGKTFCLIAPNGAVSPCPLVPDIYGNVFDTAGLLGAWRAMHDWRDNSFLPIECASCHHRNTCAGGCRYDAKIAGGTYKAPDPYCNFKNTPVLPKRRLSSRNMLSRYRVHPSIQARPESFGGIIYLRGGKWSAVDSVVLSMLQKIDAEYSRQDFSTALHVSESEANKTMNFLADKGFLLEAKN